MPLPGDHLGLHHIGQLPRSLGGHAAYAGPGVGYVVAPPTTNLHSPTHTSHTSPYTPAQSLSVQAPPHSAIGSVMPFDADYSRTKMQHVCNMCSKQFKQKSHLKRHMRIHTGERPFACDLCDRSFAQASVLKTHKRLHTKEKPYRCNECGKEFRHSGGLTEHAAVHRHKEDKQHRCTQCSNSYKTRAELSRHKKQHTRDSEYLLPESPSSSVSEPSHTPFPGGSLSGMPSLDTELNSCPGTLIPQPLTGTYVFESAGPTHYVIHLAPISVSATGTDGITMDLSVGLHHGVMHLHGQGPIGAHGDMPSLIPSSQDMTIPSLAPQTHTHPRVLSFDNDVSE